MSTNETHRDLEARLWAVLEPVVAVDGFELVEVEVTHDQGRRVLRLYIDRPDRAVTIDDTTEVTHLVDPVLDVEDPIEGAYVLEVSSPGLDRPLRKPQHFARFAGSTVRIRTFDAVCGGNRKNFKGVLKGFRDGRVEVDVDGTTFEVPHDAIARARVEHRFEEDSHR